jgi:diguanylate cyclase
VPGFDRINEINEGLAALEIDIGEKEPIRITASFGLTLLEPDISVEKSIDRADKALYAAKSAGRNCVMIWDSSMESA